MTRHLLRSAFLRLGPVSRRDQRIAELTSRVKDAEKDRHRLAERPSFQVRLNEEKRLREWELELGAPSRSVIASGKFHVYDLVRSHGIDVPEQLGRWDDPADIPWDDLPDAVVIKSARGAASRGVLPLRRVNRGWQVVTRDETMTGAQLTAQLADLVAEERIGPQFGAEEFLDDGTGRPPVDVKVFTFYGEAPLVQLRRVDVHGSEVLTNRLVDPHGVDLFDRFNAKPTDQTIPIPGALAEIVDVATRVSLIIRAAFSRIDLYDVGGRIVFGEVTPRPGTGGWFGPDLDLSMGDAWERAQVRLWRDIAGGMSPLPEWGTAGQE